METCNSSTLKSDEVELLGFEANVGNTVFQDSPGYRQRPFKMNTSLGCIGSDMLNILLGILDYEPHVFKSNGLLNTDTSGYRIRVISSWLNCGKLEYSSSCLLLRKHKMLNT